MGRGNSFPPPNIQRSMLALRRFFSRCTASSALRRLLYANRAMVFSLSLIHI